MGIHHPGCKLNEFSSMSHQKNLAQLFLNRQIQGISDKIAALDRLIQLNPQVIS